MNSLDIEIALTQKFNIRANLMVPNVNGGISGVWHECDVLVLSGAGYATEIEIKVSKADLKKDLEKRHNHYSKLIKNLYFAFPSSLAKWYEYVPAEAGIIVVNSHGKAFIIAKPKSRKEAIKWSDEKRAQLARLGALRIWGLKEGLQSMHQTCKDLRAELKELRNERRSA